MIDLSTHIGTVRNRPYRSQTVAVQTRLDAETRDRLNKLATEKRIPANTLVWAASLAMLEEQRRV